MTCDIESGYNGYVKDEMVQLLKKNGLEGKALTDHEYRKLAQELVAKIRTSKQPFIQGFLANVYDPQELAAWADGPAIKLAEKNPVKGLQAVKFTGFRKIKIPRFLKCGRKVPLLRYAVLIGASYVWDMDYNNARADGYSPTAAGTIASARAADPGLETAWDFGWGAGTLIDQGMASYPPYPSYGIIP